METVVADVIAIIEEGRKKAHSAVNTAMVEAYWLTGKRIAEEELQGQERAEYGKAIIKTLSDALTAKYGNGYSQPLCMVFENSMPHTLRRRFYTQCVQN